jgi:endonuclease/exonuclease/phosphatase (EEP) superfamily protein YafD
MPNLTPRSYAIVAVICLMGVAQQWTVDAFPWWQVTLAAYLAAMTYEWVRLRETGIGVSMTSNPRLRLGRQSTITLTLTNPSPTPHRK